MCATGAAQLSRSLSVLVALLVKLSASAGGAMSALARRQLQQPPAPVPLDSARLLMALPGRVRTCALGPPSEGGLHLADGGCGVQGK